LTAWRSQCEVSSAGGFPMLVMWRVAVIEGAPGL
jgi:hypothetical protein